MLERNSPNLGTDVFLALKERIIRWEYAPGHRFTEEGLCAEFGVSRSPVREALRMLVENGLADKSPHKGYSVKQLDLQEIHELYDVRIALETFVVERLAQGSYPETEWKTLARTWRDLRAAASAQMADFSKMDEAFHEQLATWLGNRALLQQLRTIDERLHFIRMTDITSVERLRETCEQHLRILTSIQKRDVAGARKAMQINIEDGRKNVEHAVKEALARAFLGPKAGA